MGDDWAHLWRSPARLSGHRRAPGQPFCRSEGQLCADFFYLIGGTELRKRLMSAVAVAAVAVAGGVVVPLAGPAAAAPAGGTAATADDFNGDGYADLVVATPRATVNGHTEAGEVAVLYGSAMAPATLTHHSALITQSTTGVPGTPEAYDRFGSSYATGDLDGDGYTDLAVGVPSEGLVQILWGGRNGLTYGARTVSSVTDTHAAYLFGSSVAIGDFNGDGRAQLAATGFAGVTVFNDGFTRGSTPSRAELPTGPGDTSTRGTGAVVAGDFDGDGADDLVVSGANDTDDDDDPGVWIGYYGGVPGGPDAMSFTDDPATVPLSAAQVRAAGDIDHDGYADLVTAGAGPSGAGTVAVHYGGPGGIPGSSRTTVITQDTPGVPGVNEPGDGFGAAVSVGDITGDGYADMVVGVPGEDLGTTADAGAVLVLRGSRSGVTTAGVQTFNQDTTYVAGLAERGDRFGYDTRLEDVNGDGRADLATTAQGEDIFADGHRSSDGADWVLRGSGSGLTTDDGLSFNQQVFGVTYRGKSFGSVLGD
jgi:FG-GAP repeat